MGSLCPQLHCALDAWPELWHVWYTMGLSEQLSEGVGGTHESSLLAQPHVRVWDLGPFGQQHSTGTLTPRKVNG